MQTKKYSYAITNGEMVDVFNCSKKALAVAFTLNEAAECL